MDELQKEIDANSHQVGREQSVKKYIGTKIVTATPMSRGSNNTHRGWELPADEKWDDEGYLVEYMDGGKPNHPDHKGYISWSPKDQFDNAYREIGGMTFGQAIEAMKRGDKVSRSGWNGKGLWLELQAPNSNSKMTLPYIFMSYPSDAKTTPGARVPWLASQTDMLAEDWAIVE